MRKRLLYITAAVCLYFCSSAITANAASVPNPDQMAVYLNNGFYGASAVVTGDIYSANGNIQFNNANDNVVTGNIYHKTGRQFIIPEWYQPPFASRVIELSETQSVGAIPDLLETPVIDNYVDKFIPVWNTPPLTISENTHFGTLSVGQQITVDVSQKDIYIVVDKLSCEWGKSITLNGSGRLFLFIGQCNAANPLIINNGNNPDRTYIFSKANISNPNLNLFAHLYYSEMSSLQLIGTMTGSVVTDASSLKISGGSAAVNGLVYAPNAAATVEGSGRINGRLVADSLTQNNAGRIDYNSNYSSLSQSIPAQVRKHTVIVQANIPAGGTVSPSMVDVNYGDIVQISATPNTGFLFAGFTSSNSSLLPGEDGKLKVTGSVTITANFEYAGNYSNGLLGEYYDTSELNNASALRMKRIDQNIAFNFGYDSPDPTIEPETFSIRWSGFIKPQVTGDYIFKTYSDDGVRVTVGGNEVIDKWGRLSLEFTIANEPVRLEAGKYYPITVEYQEQPLYAAVFLFWQSDNVPMSLVPGSACFIPQDTYDEYSAAKYYNQLGKSGTGLRSTFYTRDETGSRVQEYTEVNKVDYAWGASAPGAIDQDAFYGEMEGYLEAKFTESTTVSFEVDDGIRVWIGDESGSWFNDGNPVISEWDWHSLDQFSYTFDTIAGHKYRIKIEYADFGLGAACVMSWKGDSLGTEVIPAKYLYDQ